MNGFPRALPRFLMALLALAFAWGALSIQNNAGGTNPDTTSAPTPTTSTDPFYWGGGWNSGGDSGSVDNSDSGSNDWSWDSGGSDSGSDDWGWDSGGSDSGSWDSGGSWDGGGDSGSWDSGGSDSGSW